MVATGLLAGGATPSPAAQWGVNNITYLNWFAGMPGVPPDGANPKAGVWGGPASALLFGTTCMGGQYGNGTVYKYILTTGTYSVIHSLTGSDGACPAANLLLDLHGQFLYGTTSQSGNHGCGTVFKVDSAGNFTVLHSFDCMTEGGNPAGGLVQDPAGNLYGTNYESNGLPNGVVFELSPPASTGGQWTLSVLHSFTGPDGAGPKARMVRGNSGYLFGTTYGGGQYTHGTVFELTPPTAPGGKWTEKVLHSFGGVLAPGQADGSSPDGDLIADASGNLYGVTSQAGTYTTGVIYELNPFTLTYKLIEPFYPNPTYGFTLCCGLLRDSAGNLYGTANGGGPVSGTFTEVFELVGGTAFSPLFDFPLTISGCAGYCGAGNPNGPLVQDSGGNLYGTTYGGGPSGYGVLYKLTPPRLSLNPNAGYAGASVAVSGYGFAPNDTVTIYWNNTTTTLGSVTANQSGTFSGTGAFTFTVPAGSAAGKNVVLAIGKTSGAMASFNFNVL